MTHCKHLVTLFISFFIAPWSCLTDNPPTHTRTVSSGGVFRVRLSRVPAFPTWQPPQGPGHSEEPTPQRLSLSGCAHSAVTWTHQPDRA